MMLELILAEFHLTGTTTMRAVLGWRLEVGGSEATLNGL